MCKRFCFFPPLLFFLSSIFLLRLKKKNKPSVEVYLWCFIVDFLSDQTNNRFNAFKGQSTKRCEVSGSRKHPQRNGTAASSKATKPFKDSFLKNSFNDSITAAEQFSVKDFTMANNGRTFTLEELFLSSRSWYLQTERGRYPQVCGITVTKVPQCRCGHTTVSTIGFSGKMHRFFFICPSSFAL